MQKFIGMVIALTGAITVRYMTNNSLAAICSLVVGIGGVIYGDAE